MDCLKYFEKLGERSVVFVSQQRARFVRLFKMDSKFVIFLFCVFVVDVRVDCSQTVRLAGYLKLDVEILWLVVRISRFT